MLVVPEKKALVVRPRDPNHLLALIPTAKPVYSDGKTFVAVPHKLDETRVLSNLGFKAPSPIRYYYNWSGSLTPFKAQMDTAEFLSLRPRAYVLNEMGCVDASTEYLSPTGWKRIDQYDGGPVAQYHPDTGAAEFVQPTEYVKLPCPTMLRIKTKYGLDQLLSPEHRVLLQSRGNPSKRETLQAADLMVRQEQWLAGTGKKSLTAVGWTDALIPVSFVSPGGAGMPLTDEKIRLQVAVIADAHFPNRTNRCVIRLKRQRKKERLEKLLADACVEYKRRDVTSGTAVGYTVYSFEAPTRDKTFSGPWWDCTPEQLRVVCDEVMHWDGSVSDDKPGARFSTLQRESADFVQYAFAGTCRVARVHEAQRRGKTEFSVQVRNNGEGLMLASKSSDGQRRRVMTEEPSPDGFKYCFMVPSTYLVLRRNGCVFMSGNTGKTLASLWSFDYLRSLGFLHRLLVVCPLSTMERTWADEVFRHFPHLDFAVLHGTRDRRKKLLAQQADVYIVNHDGLDIIQEDLATRPDIDLVISDEVAQSARNANTDRWRAQNEVVNKQLAGTRWCWGMTGTPVPNEPSDAWAQCRLITPSTVPNYYGRFRDMVMRQAGPYKWVARPDAMDKVYSVMAPAIRFSRKECVDLPDCTFKTEHVPMTPQQQKVYKEMFNTLAAQIAGGEVLAVNEAVKTSKLVQIACGIAYDRDGNEVTVGAKPRLELTHDIVMQAGSKVIVFVPFVSSVGYVADYLKNQGLTVECIYGEVPKHERDRIFQAFQHSSDPRVLVAQPAAMSHGLTLTAANTIVWYAPIFSNDIYDQACARITRPGQKLAQLIVNIEGSPVEQRMYARLATKQKMQGILLSMVEEAKNG